MGICIDYRGKLNSPNLYPDFAAFVKTEAGRLGWPCEQRMTTLSGLLLRERSTTPLLIEGEQLRGLWVHPPDTEPINFTVDKRGEICHYRVVPHFMLATAAIPGETYYFRFPTWVKTTSAVESHLFIIGMLRGIKRHFMRNLRVSDDGEYWETSNLRKLTEHHQIMSAVSQLLQSPEVFQSMLQSAGQDIEPLRPRVRRMVN